MALDADLVIADDKNQSVLSEFENLIRNITICKLIATLPDET